MPSEQTTKTADLAKHLGPGRRLEQPTEARFQGITHFQINTSSSVSGLGHDFLAIVLVYWKRLGAKAV